MRIAISRSQSGNKEFMGNLKENYPNATVFIVGDEFYNEWNQTLKACISAHKDTE